MNDIFLYFVAFILLLGALIVIHEFGHFLVARLCGVKVLRFSVGFGPVLWRRCFGKDKTEWTLCALPFGGYVKMLDEREEAVRVEEIDRAFNRQSVGKRMAIVVAGPLFNFLLAILVYWAMFCTGSEELRPIIGAPLSGTPAASAGLKNGDLAVKVGGVPVTTWVDFRWQVLQQAANAGSIELELKDAQNITRLTRLDTGLLAKQGWQGDPAESLGLRPYLPPVPPVVGKLVPDMPAQAAGLQEGDRFVAVDGKPVTFWFQVLDAVSSSAGQEMRFIVLRQGREVGMRMTPKAEQAGNLTIGRIGVQWAEAPDIAMPPLFERVSYGVFESAVKAVRQTWETSIFSLKMFGKMLTGEVSWRNLSGPLTIAEYAGKTAKLGLDPYFKFLALVSISLGILNLLPIPVLDGGHLMYYCLEVIKGGPVSERVMAWGQQLGLALLLTLMAFALFNDLSRYLAPLFNG
jgi:regulator of sigma E protease